MSWDTIQGKFAAVEGVQRMVMFERVEEVEVGPPLLLESNKLDCIVGSTMLGRVQGMSALVGLEGVVELDEAALEPPSLMGNSKLDCIAGSTMPDKVQGMLAAVGRREAQG